MELKIKCGLNFNSRRPASLLDFFKCVGRLTALGAESVIRELTSKLRPTLQRWKGMNPYLLPGYGLIRRLQDLGSIQSKTITINTKTLYIFLSNENSQIKERKLKSHNPLRSKKTWYFKKYSKYSF